MCNTVDIDSSTFNLGLAAYGGALAIIYDLATEELNAQISIASSDIVESHSILDGGVIYVIEDSSTVSNTQHMNINMQLTDTRFDQNQANYQGGISSG